MEKDNILEEDDKHMSWDEFKEEYLPKVEYLAKIVGVPRKSITDVRHSLCSDGERFLE